MSMKAIEVEGSIDENRQLHFDAPLPVDGPANVRVIILFHEPDEFEESEWISAAANNPEFEFLNDPAEDIYSQTDGKPFVYEG